MKLVRMLLAATMITFVAACNATNPVGPDTGVPVRPVYNGGYHGSNG
jgi:predicted small secreted protein